MKTKFKVSIFCGLAALAMSMGVQAENTFTLGGDVELDITAKDSDDHGSDFYHGGRVKLNAVGEIKNENYFVKGVAQPLVPINEGDIGIDDAYLQFGQGNWDLQIGRFEGFDLMPLGKDKVVEHASDVLAGGVDVYRANAARGRKDDVLHGALHMNASDALKFELGAMAQKDGDEDFYAVRPAVVYSTGAFTIRAGFETITENTFGVSETDTDEHQTTGYGISASFAAGPGSIGAGVAQRQSEMTAAGANTVDNPDVTTANVHYSSDAWGVGYIYSQEDVDSDPTLNTFYGAYTMPLLGSKDASVTIAASTSKFDSNSGDDSTNAVRLRFNYAF